MTKHVEDVNDLTFDAQVLASEQPYLLDFSATWCAPCRALNPIIESIAEQYQGQLRVGKIDMDDSPGVASRYGVRGAPTLILFRNGQEAARRIGLTTRDVIVKLTGVTTQPASAHDGALHHHG